MTELSLAERRYLHLVRQLLEEAGATKHGARTAVGRQVGIPQSHVTQLLDGAKRPGLRVIERAMKGLGLAPDYFFGRGPVELDYRDFLPASDSRVELDHEDTPAWRELVELGWLDRYRRRGLSEAQIEYARRTLFRGAPSVDDYVDVLEAMVRALQRPEAPEMAAARAKSERDGTPSAKHWVPTPPEDDPGPAPKGRKKAKR